MSGIVTGWLLRHPDGPDDLAYRMVLVAMADLADNDAENIRGASRYIAELARVSRRYARDLIERALEDEWLEVTRPGDRRRPTVYRFRVDSAPPITSADENGRTALGGPRAPITLPADRVMGGASAHTWAPQERPQRAAQERPNTVLRSNGFSAGPDPDPRGVRSVAQGSPPGAPEANAVGRAEALRAARDALAARCDRCDEHGWLTHPDGTVQVCDHKARPVAEPAAPLEPDRPKPKRRKAKARQEPA